MNPSPEILIPFFGITFPNTSGLNRELAKVTPASVNRINESIIAPMLY